MYHYFRNPPYAYESCFAVNLFSANPGTWWTSAWKKCPLVRSNRSSNIIENGWKINEQWRKPWLFVGYIVDYTTHLHGDYNKPVWGSLLNRPEFRWNVKGNRLWRTWNSCLKSNGNVFVSIPEPIKWPQSVVDWNIWLPWIFCCSLHIQDIYWKRICMQFTQKDGLPTSQEVWLRCLQEFNQISI